MSVRRYLTAFACAATAASLSAAPAGAIVGGGPASPGEYPSVAEITFGGFLCTGTLIAPTKVLSAGHCGSVTGGSGVASPASWPAQLITVRVGGHTSGTGERVPVSSVAVPNSYLLTNGWDISLLTLSRASTKASTPVTTDGSLWTAGKNLTIVGWGATREGGGASSTLQEAVVPRMTDAQCSGYYGSSFNATTMLCAGFPQGGIDTCQGDSGGPLFGKTATGAWRVTGVTSWGEGCARANAPGVYGRVAADPMRSWVAQRAPGGVQ